MSFTHINKHTTDDDGLWARIDIDDDGHALVSLYELNYTHELDPDAEYGKYTIDAGSVSVPDLDAPRPLYPFQDEWLAQFIEALRVRGYVLNSFGDIVDVRDGTWADEDRGCRGIAGSEQRRVWILFAAECLWYADYRDCSVQLHGDDRDLVIACAIEAL